jgi:hypothetical protein
MWILPTRGRPERCQQALDSIAAAETTTPGVVSVGGDIDPAYEQLKLPADWRIEFSDQPALCPRLNDVFERNRDEPWYGLLNDDFIVETAGWDVKLSAAAGRHNMASFDDGWVSAQNPILTINTFGGDLVRALGWLVLPGVKHLYADNLWHDLARALGNHVHCDDVKIEHRHHMNGKAPIDATYQAGIACQPEDERVYHAFREHGFNDALGRARRCIQGLQP